ncbi:hypothetical protein TSMEX_001636 [Taenia solium]|eukprot:TsM_000921000 transcript=TsM_000921000 gene=TsM_000921000
MVDRLIRRTSGGETTKRRKARTQLVPRIGVTADLAITAQLKAAQHKVFYEHTATDTNSRCTSRCMQHPFVTVITATSAAAQHLAASLSPTFLEPQPVRRQCRGRDDHALEVTLSPH